MSKLIAVFGATGAQGGSVLRSLIKTGTYHVRAITRNPNSGKAKQLASLSNVSVHQADLDDQTSISKVLKNCYGAFLVTDFSAHFEHKETKQGTDLIDNAIKNNLSHVVFSGLENVASVIGKPCLHFDYKAAVEDYGLKHSNKISFTSIRLPAYYQVLPGMMLYKIEPNKFVITLPMADKSMFCMNVDEIGDCVKTILDNPSEYKSKIVPVAGDKLNGKEIESIFNAHLAPNKFMYGNFSLEKFLSFGFPGVEDITNMFEYYQTDKMHRDIHLAKRLNDNVLNFNDWVAKNKQQLLENISKL